MSEPKMIWFVLIEHNNEFGFPAGFTIKCVRRKREDAQAEAKALRGLTLGILTEGWFSDDYRTQAGE